MKNKREKIVIRTSIISIATNFLLAGFKALVGILANSIAIISDAINNISDVLSSTITIVGTKLAGKAPDKKHPYGYGRIEYMTSLVVSAIVLYAGFTALVESVKKMINPSIPKYSIFTLIIVTVGIITKFVLGLYVKTTGKKVNSDSLVASGTDALNDGIISISVLLSAIIYILFHINLEAYVGIILSLMIVKTGLELVKESVDNMLGSRVETSLSKKIKKEVNKEEEVKGAFDLMLDNYGPDKYLGSIHIEVDDTLTVADIDKLSRRISKNVLEKYGVILHTIGVYSVNTKDKDVIEARKKVNEIVFANKSILQLHGFYLDKEDKTISFDIIIDFKEKAKEELYKKIYDEVKEKYPDYKINITLDVDTSD